LTKGDSLKFIQRGVLDIKFATPLILAILIATTMGAWSSKYIPIEIVKWVLVEFLITASILLLYTKRETKIVYDKSWILFFVIPTLSMGMHIDI